MCDLLPLESPLTADNFPGLSLEDDVFISPRELLQIKYNCDGKSSRGESSDLTACVLPPVGQVETIVMHFNAISH